jgi:hypothetical protein
MNEYTTDYKVLIAMDVGLLEESVKKYIERDWTPIDGIVVEEQPRHEHSRYLQTMIKIEGFV